jgi:N-dimethylarginine dimethylaminohydrolase
MFPSNVRDRLYQEQEENVRNQKQHDNLKTYLRSEGSNVHDRPNSESKPLADLFTETTIMVSKCPYNLEIL